MIDLRPQFKHLHWRPMPHAFGHEVASDWADKSEDDPVFGLYKNCGLWTMEEAQILYECAERLPMGSALDIGSHTGWTSMHMRVAGHRVVAVDPMYTNAEFHERAMQNTENGIIPVAKTSLEYFAGIGPAVIFDIICIDGDHGEGKPMEDADAAEIHLADTGVIIFHDFVGRPVREAVQWLMGEGFHCRIYFTAHGVACCGRGDFKPPDHKPDPYLYRCLTDGRMNDFDFTRCE